MATPVETRAEPLAAEERRLLVAIPALDEEPTIAEVVRGIPRSLEGITRVDVVVVDDGSSDGTAAIAAAAGAEVLRHEGTRGVGAAFATALRHGVDRGYDLIATIDGDGQFDPADLAALVAPIVSGRAEFATASRFADPKLVPQMPALKVWGNRMMARLVSRLTGQSFYDVSCGMRCYSRRAAQSLNPLGRFTYTQEVFLNLAFKQLRIVEVPIAVRGEREFGNSRVASNLWVYALRTSGIIFRCYRDYQPLRFFGAISLALLVPAAALALFVMAHYLATGGFSPHKWAGALAAVLSALGVLVFSIAVVGDMLNRHRIYLEDLLFHQRSRQSGDGDRGPGTD